MHSRGDIYGLHRVVEGHGELPQGAVRLDPSLPIYTNEILIEVERLNIDSTSFKQIFEVADQKFERIKERIFEIVRTRGKLHNPVTNSGGMLVGRVKEIGKDYPGALQFKEGEKIATLVSLTLTPLFLTAIDLVDAKTGQVTVKGHAILFESGIACRLPEDLPERVSLAVLDVCGAPALTLRHVRPEDKVLFVGAGKSAKLSAATLRQSHQKNVRIDCVDINEEALSEMEQLGLADKIFVGDATKVSPSPVPPPLEGGGGGEGGYDLVINVANVPGTEMSSILSVKEGGKILFFSMATEFDKVALGAEGVGKDADFIMGSGYAKGHADLALKVVRENRKLREWFERKYL